MRRRAVTAKKDNKKPKRMTVKRAFEVIEREIHCYCAHYDEEANEQCRNMPTLTFSNIKFDTESHWCKEHCPSESHYADRTDPFESGEALAFLRAALEKTSAKK